MIGNKFGITLLVSVILMSGCTENETVVSSSEALETAISETVADEQFEVRPEIEATWQEEGVSYFKYKITLINNSSEACTSWQIELTFDQDFQLSDSWNGSYTVERTSIIISSLDYNGDISAQSSYNDIGFIVCGDASLTLEEY